MTEILNDINTLGRRFGDGGEPSCKSVCDRAVAEIKRLRQELINVEESLINQDRAIAELVDMKHPDSQTCGVCGSEANHHVTTVAHYCQEHMAEIKGAKL